jgi:hypothetical protein
MKRFLIAHWNDEMRETLHGALYEAFEEDGERPYIDSRDNKAEALLSCSSQDFDFIIVSLSLAADRKQPIAPNQGLEFLRLLRRRGHEMPVLLVAPTTQLEIEYAIREYDGIPVYEDNTEGTLEENVIRRANYSFESPTGIARNRLDIEINLADATFSIKDQRSIMHIAETGKLEFHGERLQALTRQLIDKVQGPEPDWEIHLRELGAQLQRDLFEDPGNLRFRDAYWRAKTMTRCSGDAARIRFVVSEHEQYVFPLEAILMPERPEYWMLQAPLFRTVKEEYPKARPLFQDPKDLRWPINCLLINADTFGTVDKPQCELARMRRTKDECVWLRRELEKRREELNIGKIRLLSADEPDEDNTPFWDNVTRLLKAEAWHLVHYAGHSYYDEQDKTGYIFLPEEDSFTPRPIEATDFASEFCEIPRFVYLSSCESSADDFVFQLARNGIPAVAGFRWGVEENAAYDYAKSFYKHLFEKRCLEEAFWKARKEIHDDRDREQNHIWAAAMLVIQTSR